MPDRTIRVQASEDQLRDLANGKRIFATPAEFPCQHVRGKRHVIGVLVERRENAGLCSRLDLSVAKLVPGWDRMPLGQRFKALVRLHEQAEQARDWMTARAEKEGPESNAAGPMLATRRLLEGAVGELWAAIVRIGDQDPFLSVEVNRMAHDPTEER